ncbi:dr1-associated corepressor homolog [Lucilia sericata]|uniref:dr1-associated corepressor homolog n=1 Tax=Lucilia sericata TaxID=13632 RepID=UPI0018A7F5B9|nr:dr1-associated corepressor homolog [Lucilia sericata]
MPSKKKKYNARFPAGRIKKIMQSDEEVGKVAQAVPIIISRTLELFVDSLLTKTLKITNSRNAKTLSTSHMKQCIMSEQRFDFLRELVRNIPDISVAEEAANYQEEDNQSSPEEQYPDSDTPYDLSMPSTSLRAGRQQQQQQHTISNGHNGGGHHATQVHAAHQPHEYQRNYLKRSMSSNPSSVIRHTTAMAQTNVDCLPAKLARSDSTPVPQQQQLSTAASLTTVQHPRLKHQSYSMPTHMENSNNNNNNNNNNKPNTQTPLKTLRTPSQQTAIPAPIVNIDYCSKPVVKIDYSNLPLAGVTASANAVAAPLSAPANIASTAFNFSAEPVINIDLSNIVASPTSAIPSMATISIGTPTLPPPPKLPASSSSASSCTAPSTLTTSSSSLSSLINKTKPLTAKTAVVEQQSRNSKAAMAEPFNSTSSSSTTNTTKATALAAAVAAATTMTTTISATKSDSYLDMDEDYDNI